MSIESFIKTIIKIILSNILVILLAVFIGTVLIISTGLISEDSLSKNAEESAAILYEEKQWPELWKGNTATKLDNYTDSMLISTVSTKEEGDSVINDALMAKRVQYGEKDPLTSLYKLYAGKKKADPIYVTYARYWHGYMIFLKPLLLFGNISMIRAINMLLQFLLIACIMAQCIRKGYNWLCPPLLLAWISISPIAVTMSLQFSPVFYITGLSALLIITKGKDLSLVKTCIVFEMTGILVAYFDMLTYPAASLGIPLILMILISEKKQNTPVTKLIKTAACAISWAFGYSVMWFSKWAICTVLTGQNVFAEAQDAAIFRTSNSYKDRVFTWSGTIIDNAKVLFSYPFVLAIFITALVFIYYLFITKKWAISDWMDLILVILCSFIPMMWYMVLKNHSSIHFWMTFRLLSVTVFGMACLLFMGFKKQEPVKRSGRRRRYKDKTTDEDYNPDQVQTP